MQQVVKMVRILPFTYGDDVTIHCNDDIKILEENFYTHFVYSAE
jgi:hypothetical protein